MMKRFLVSAFGMVATLGVAAAAPLTVPFEFSHRVIGLDVTVKDTPLFMIVDTGVDPSVIDLTRTMALGIKIDRGDSGEASGEGDATRVEVFPAVIEGLAIRGHTFAPFDTLATDMSTLSAKFGRKLDGVLGYSFLADKIILIDYPKRRISILDRPMDAAAMVRSCPKRWSAPLKSLKDDSIPVISAFRFGTATAPISLDTGSNSGIALYQKALDLPGLRAALVKKGIISYAGARGNATAASYLLNEPVGFGPFTLPAGQVVTLRKVEGSASTRLANIGNEVFATMKLKMLLNYRTRLMTFYGDCR